MSQLTYYNTNFKKRIFPITLVCDNVTNAPNIGSLFRIADAFGVEKLIFCGNDIPLGRKMTKTSRSTEKIVPYEVHKNTIDLLKSLKTSGYHLVSLEITANSAPLRNYQFSQTKPIVLIVGAENLGISENILELSDAIIHIDMYGQNSSMNVVQAANICLYEMTKQLL